ncbi:prolycopene isomerase chloroplastic-like, partial [Trifolium medium]|nr:prolycopene isomerase chloroplastic-like [Trifolium medium]
MCPAMNTMRGVGVFPCNVVRVRRQCSRIHHLHSSFHNNNNGRILMRKCFVVRNSSSKLDDDAEADVIVIGSGIGGLSCAAMLARYEQDVVLLESHDVAGGAAHSFDVKGYKFDSGPSLFSGLQSRGPQANPLAQVLDALGESVPCA